MGFNHKKKTKQQNTFISFYAEPKFFVGIVLMCTAPHVATTIVWLAVILSKSGCN